MDSEDGLFSADLPTYFPDRLILILPMSQKIYPCNLEHCFELIVTMEYRALLTAAVPKIAPLAPTEGKPTSEKFPPRIFLKRKIE